MSSQPQSDLDPGRSGERTNAKWLADLKSPNPDGAIADLRAILLNGLQAALSSSQNQGLELILEDIAQEALLKILNNTDSFRGESRFTTWAQKISINVAFTELRRRRWRNVSLQEMTDQFDHSDFTPALLTDPSFSPEQLTLLANAIELVDRVMSEELSDKQRDALTAVVLAGAPMEAVAERMGTNRNALYKLIHDARKRLKERLVQNGFSAEEILDIFED